MSIRMLSVIFILITLVLPLGCSSSGKVGRNYEVPRTLDEALDARILSVESAIKGDGYDLGRVRRVREEGERLGHNLGRIEQVRRNNNWLLSNSMVLATSYNFSQIMIDGKFLPPRIDRIDGQEKTVDGVLHRTRVHYEIATEPTLVIEAPTFVDYLFQFEPPAYELNPVAMPLASRKDEVRAWQEGLRRGYVTGIAEPYEALKIDFAELDRDYKGMKRYYDLIMQGKLDRPEIKSDDRGIVISNNGKRLSVGDEVFWIVDNDYFVSPEKWRLVLNGLTEGASNEQ